MINATLRSIYLNRADQYNLVPKNVYRPNLLLVKRSKRADQIDRLAVNADELAILKALHVHGTLSDAQIKTKTNAIVQTAIEHTLDTMFPNNDVTLENFKPRAHEFNTLLVARIAHYGTTWHLPVSAPASVTVPTQP
jgi:hypothetical protein